MPGKKRAWLRQAVKRICLCGKIKTPFSDEDESPLASIVPLSALPTKSESIRIPASKSPAASPRFTPDPLTRSYAGAYPPKEANRAASNPFLTDDEVYGSWKQQAGIKHPAVTRCKDQDLETKTKTLRKQSSAASTNTIGWDTPVGEFTAGKQAYHHPTGMLELRNKGSINLLNSLEEAAAKEFQEFTSRIRHTGTRVHQIPCHVAHRALG
ncbi:hypothetical protein BU25DRAFT_418293 [Macroventuria anomochaeta]|uniref:Uncharacterized protein n=1 Tax=Macroventuria anomochaeta TaxID=301207 RepID=A0ACB6SBS6_9PLEO|nr:uncharacterized protein BU25DRAFT_418293 [Macroventuria anomochaeta]KAF2631504.1 hypothetical protein BU25DRAFT_418293 [Macroventuria anomochaeta]